jgi:hypothetical protein
LIISKIKAKSYKKVDNALFAVDGFFVTFS